MSTGDQTVGGIFASIFSVKKTSETYNTYHHNTDLYLNSSQAKILSLSGSNSKGMMLNDARFNTNNVFERSIFFNLSQHSTLLSLILVFTLSFFLTFLIVASFIVYRKKQQLKQKRQHKYWNIDQPYKIHHKKDIHLLNKSIMLSALKLMQNGKEQNGKKLLKESNNMKKDIKPSTAIIVLPEHDKMSKNGSPIDLHQNHVATNIYDIPPVYSISQWAHDVIGKYMKP